MTNGVPIMSGEHTCLSDRSSRAQNLYMYKNGGESSDAYGPGAGQYMKVLAPNHPIMQAFRSIHRARASKSSAMHMQRRMRTCRKAATPITATATPSSGLAMRPRPQPSWAYWTPTPSARASRSPMLAGNCQTAARRDARRVHFFVCEGGGGETRRCFNALSDLGRVIFVRAAKWAMGESLEPYRSVGIIDVTQVSPARIKVSWSATADKSYKLLGTANLKRPLGLLELGNNPDVFWSGCG